MPATSTTAFATPVSLAFGVVRGSVYDTDRQWVRFVLTSVSNWTARPLTMATWSDRPPSTLVSARPFRRSDRSPTARGLRWLIVGVVIAAVLVPAPAVAQTAILDRILAIVDGQIIMHSDVRAVIDLGLVDIPLVRVKRSTC